MSAITLPKYRLIVDHRHLNNTITAIPTLPEGVQGYDLPSFGRYGCAVTIETKLKPDHRDLVCIVPLKGEPAYEIPSDAHAGFALAHDSSQYYFFGDIVLLLECSLASPITAQMLPRIESDVIRHTYMICRIESVLRLVARGNCPQKVKRFGEYLLHKLLSEYNLLSAQDSKARLAKMFNGSWEWLCDLNHGSYTGGCHVRLLWKLHEDNLIVWH